MWQVLQLPIGFIELSEPGESQCDKTGKPRGEGKASHALHRARGTQFEQSAHDQPQVPRSGMNQPALADLFKTAEPAPSPSSRLTKVRERSFRNFASPPLQRAAFRTPDPLTVQADGTLEKAQQMAAHASSRTTNLYNRVRDDVSLEEVERVLI